jgi:hypothetical protein
MNPNPDESSLEFDMFEDMRRTLTRILAAEGRDPVEAERIAFYVVQGVREVPKLLTALARHNAPDKQVRALLGDVLNNVPSLERARAMLLDPDAPVVH